MVPVTPRCFCVRSCSVHDVECLSISKYCAGYALLLLLLKTTSDELKKQMSLFIGPCSLWIKYPSLGLCGHNVMVSSDFGSVRWDGAEIAIYDSWKFR